MSVVNIAVSPSVELFSVLMETELLRPIIAENISAGFPSPAMDFEDVSIDLNKYVIKRPSSTFFGRVKGNSMKNIGIGDDDLIVIDKSIKPLDNMIAVCYLDGGFTIKRILMKNDRCFLIPANDDYKTVVVNEDNDFHIWGIVTYVIKSMKDVRFN